VKGVAECRAKNPWRWAASFSSTLRLSMVDLYDLYARRAPRIPAEARPMVFGVSLILALAGSTARAPR
jgi:hypothetical protein